MHIVGVLEFMQICVVADFMQILDKPGLTFDFVPPHHSLKYDNSIRQDQRR